MLCKSKIKLPTLRGASSWLYSVPWGLRKLLGYIKDKYGDLPIFVLENGFSDSDGRLDDRSGRVEYLGSHLKAILEGWLLWGLYGIDVCMC